MQVTIINDCCDQNAKLRQVSRAGSLFENASVNCFGVKSEMEAAGFLVDAIDAFDGREGIVLVNVAPRNKNNETSKNRHWKNGAPFGYFWYRKTLIISSVDGLTLSLVKKLQINDEIFALNISKVLDEVRSDLNEAQKQRIINSQFRSFDFLPRAARWLWEKQDLPKEKFSLSEIKNIYPAVWLIDNFGNIKTTLLEDELNYISGGKAEIKIKYQEKTIKEKFTVYKHLKDLPENEIGLIVGSSGFKDKRFMEIILNGGSAAEHLNILE
jgi:hypothetical protein